MNFSYWENKHFVNKTDITIIGAGITGLTSSIFLKKRFPNKTIRILERGITPWGASTKNAGFACFGSVSEILSDFDLMGEDKTTSLVERRWLGLIELRSLISDKGLGLINNGGYELFTNHQSQLANTCLEQIGHINTLLKPIFKEDVFSDSNEDFGFEGVNHMVKCKFESQVDTGLMMKSLIQKAKDLEIEILYGCNVTSHYKANESVKINLEGGPELETSQLVLCSNGFVNSLLPDLGVKPARAQVLVTKPIPDLKIKGTFHLEEGYYYFRNIDDRILFGGGRNLDFKGEETTEMENTKLVMDQLKRYLDQIILPDGNYEIDYSWAGIMGVGSDKQPIVKKIDEAIYCGVKFGGMGVALGTLIGKQLSEIVES